MLKFRLVINGYKGNWHNANGWTIETLKKILLDYEMEFTDDEDNTD